jgi:hypothetical protein
MPALEVGHVIAAEFPLQVMHSAELPQRSRRINKPNRSHLPPVSHRVGLRVHDPGSIPSSLTHRLVRAGLSAHNANRRRYRSQFT